MFAGVSGVAASNQCGENDDFEPQNTNYRCGSVLVQPTMNENENENNVESDKNLFDDTPENDAENESQIFFN